MRKTFIAGNWKMFNGPKETKAFFEDFRKKYLDDGALQAAVKRGRAKSQFFRPSYRWLRRSKPSPARTSRSARRTAILKKTALSPAKFRCR